MTAPRMVGRYQVKERVASGSFATVWRARDHDLDTDVAIKILADNWAGNDDVRGRFVEEARMLRRAYSDRIVRVYDIGTTDGDRPYFVMSFADRGTLHDRLVDGRLPTDVALTYTRQACEGIAALHELGVLHRDIKPSNIVFISTGAGERLLIADLGLAKSMIHGSALTITGGTPGYMAPEQAVQGGRVDPRTDVYGLGAVAYHMLTGTPTTSPVTPPTALCPDLTTPVEAVVMRALHRDPAARWQDVPTLIHALDDLLAHQPSTAPTAGATPTPATTADTDPRAPAATPATPPHAAPHIAAGTPTPTTPTPATTADTGPHTAPPAAPPPPPPHVGAAAAPAAAGAPRGAGRRVLGMRTPVFLAVLGCLVLVLLVLVPVGVWAGPKVWIRVPSTVSSEDGAVGVKVRPLWTTDDLRVEPTEDTVPLSAYGAGAGEGIRLTTQVPAGEDAVQQYDGVRGVTLIAGRALADVPAEELLDAYPSEAWRVPDTSPSCVKGDPRQVKPSGFEEGLVRVYDCNQGLSFYLHAVVVDDDAAVHVFVAKPVDATEDQLDDLVRSVEVDATKLP